jgi:peptidoglycan/xylan/chitin deacetylase (PgdA/CDA1 family)
MATFTHHLNVWLVIAVAAAAFGATPAVEPAAAATRLHSGCANRLATRSSRRHITVPILMYHRIDVARPTTPVMTRRLTVDPSDFAAQMSWLDSHGYTTVTQRELFAALMCGRGLGPKPIMITFDDGYRDVFFNASTTLLRLGMHATAYVITGRISGSDSSFLTWPLLRALERRGIEIGSHTVSHVDLTSVTDTTAIQELVRSRLSLEHALHHAVPWLAYPSGRFSAHVETLARRAGYLLAVTTRESTVQTAGAPLALSRLRILDTTGVHGLAALLGD